METQTDYETFFYCDEYTKRQRRSADKSVERTIEWEWLYASDNDNAYSGKDISFSLKAVAEQVIENAG